MCLLQILRDDSQQRKEWPGETATSSVYNKTVTLILAPAQSQGICCFLAFAFHAFFFWLQAWHTTTLEQDRTSYYPIRIRYAHLLFLLPVLFNYICSQHLCMSHLQEWEWFPNPLSDIYFYLCKKKNLASQLKLPSVLPKPKFADIYDLREWNIDYTLDSS